MKASVSFRSAVVFALISAMLFVSNSSAQACAACYGDTSGSRMSDAAAVGIFAMVVIMFAMLGAVAGFGWYLAYRAKHPLPDYEELLQQDDAHPEPGTSH